MQVKAFCTSTALLLAVAGSTVAAQTMSATHWLQRLQNAQASQAYQGAFVYERKGAFSSHQVVRQASPEGQIVEHFTQLSGPAHEVLRVDGVVACASAALADDLAVIDVWPQAGVTVQDLPQWYDVQVVGETRIAGRDAAVLLFSPRDQHRYPIEMSVDTLTAVPLQSLLLNEKGQLLERLQFVQFSSAPEQTAPLANLQDLTPGAGCIPLQAPAMNREAVAEKDWAVNWTPPGFSLLKSHYQVAYEHDGSVLNQVYSDGLAHFSVYIENIDNLEVESSRRQLGPTAVVSKKIQRADETLMVTVVGEIPLGSAERIALSMHAGQDLSDD